MLCDFSYSHYLDILSTLETGRTVTTFEEAKDVGGGFLVLRHDVDYSLDKALELARVESRHGYKSTYFVMLSSEVYNPLEAEEIKKVREFEFLGHSIGLHVNSAPTMFFARGMAQGILDQVKLLNSITRKKVKVVSFHNPGELDKKLEICGLINTYSSVFFKDARYVSDSCMRWRERCPHHGFEDKSVQFLAHPIWWNEKVESLDDIVSGFFRQKRQRLDSIEKNYFSYYR